MWGLCESEISDMLDKGGRRTAASPSATADTLSEGGHTTCPARSIQAGEKAKAVCFQAHASRRHVAPRHCADGDETRPDDGCSEHGPQCAHSRGRVRGNARTHTTRRRTPFLGESLWRLERCHCWSPAWPLSWLWVWWSRLTHHCCVARVQKRDAAYHML